jgi:hypothetical protein
MREVIRSLNVWDAVVRRQIVLPPGTILTECQIRRHRDVGGEDGLEAYAMEFEMGGQHCACPLFLFQPRTKPVDPSPAAL